MFHHRAVAVWAGFLSILCALLVSGCRRNAPLDPSVLDLAGLDDIQTARSSSWDRTGGNKDCVAIEAGETKLLADLHGPGSIRHFYVGTTTPAGAFSRELVLRFYWDGEQMPSVEVPFGDFFLTSYEAFVRPINSALVAVNPGMSGLGSHGYHAYFPMPYNAGARITVENQSRRRSGQLCYHIEHESYRALVPSTIGRFHAQWHRQFTSAAWLDDKYRNKVQWPGKNTDGKNNYVILEAEGKGRLIGLLLSIDNGQPGWYGEGDDMIFIDGETWPPSYHGTGTEEIFGAGATPNEEFTDLYTGFLVTENRGHSFGGKASMFRWYVHDPIRFSRSIRWTIEHGHANNYENDYTSVAYWYQSEPHKPFPPLPPAADRLPSMPAEYFKAREMLLSTQEQLHRLDGFPPDVREKMREMRKKGHRLFQDRQYSEALAVFEQHAKELDRLTRNGH
jgi:hypothetical protein